MSADLLALVAAMPMPEPDLQDHDIEVWGQNAKADFYSVAQYRAGRREAAELVLAQGEPIGEVVIGEDGTTKGWTVVRWRADLPPIAVGTKLYAATVSPATVVNAEMLAALKSAYHGLSLMLSYHGQGSADYADAAQVAADNAMDDVSAAIASAEAAAKGAA